MPEDLNRVSIANRAQASRYLRQQASSSLLAGRPGGAQRDALGSPLAVQPLEALPVHVGHALQPEAQQSLHTHTCSLTVQPTNSGDIQQQQCAP